MRCIWAWKGRVVAVVYVCACQLGVCAFARVGVDAGMGVGVGVDADASGNDVQSKARQGTRHDLRHKADTRHKGKQKANGLHGIRAHEVDNALEFARVAKRVAKDLPVDSLEVDRVRNHLVVVGELLLRRKDPEHVAHCRAVSRTAVSVLEDAEHVLERRPDSSTLLVTNFWRGHKKVYHVVE